MAGARHAGPEDRSGASERDVIGGAGGTVERDFKPRSKGLSDCRVIVGKRGEHGFARSNGRGGVDEDAVALAVFAERPGPLGVGEVWWDVIGPGPPARPP